MHRGNLFDETVISTQNKHHWVSVFKRLLMNSIYIIISVLLLSTGHSKQQTVHMSHKRCHKGRPELCPAYDGQTFNTEQEET